MIFLWVLNMIVKQQLNRKLKSINSSILDGVDKVISLESLSKNMTDLIEVLLSNCPEEKPLPTVPSPSPLIRTESRGKNKDAKKIKQFKELLVSCGHSPEAFDKFFPLSKIELEFLLMFRKKVDMMHSSMINDSLIQITMDTPKSKKVKKS